MIVDSWYDFGFPALFIWCWTLWVFPEPCVEINDDAESIRARGDA